MTTPAACLVLAGALAMTLTVKSHLPVRPISASAESNTLARARQGPMTPSSRTLDNHYYDVAANPAAYPLQRLLFSDRLLVNGSATAGQFEAFRTDQSAWAAAFAQQYQEMTMLGVQPSQGYGVNSGWCDGCGEYRGSAVRSSSLPSFFRGPPDLFP